MNELARKIAAETETLGAISFARFMELALYCPVYGYYESEGDKIGRRGDFYTSVSVGPLFGELLACQFADWFAACRSDPKCQLLANSCHEQGQGDVKPAPRFRLVEAGTYRGQLALDILSWLRNRRPGIFSQLQYCILEPSARARQWQMSKLAEFHSVIRWVGAVEDLDSGFTGSGRPWDFTVFFSNELLDALPVHRVGWDATRHCWFEWGVTEQDGRFDWARLPLARHTLESWSEASGFAPMEALEGWIPDGFTVEFSPAAVDWWREAAGVLGPGKLVTIDYGAAATELLTPERREGTLRAYHRHRLSGTPLDHPGEQDLTAHVNFTAIEAAGSAAGLHTDSFVSQGEFLTAIAARIWKGELDFGEWTSHTTRQFQTLTHPQHLGRSFCVLVQGE